MAVSRPRKNGGHRPTRAKELPVNTQTLGIHRGTYDAVFRHPLARNLAWRDVRSMLDALPDVVLEEHDGTLKLSGLGRTLILHRPPRKTMDDVQELMNLRRFLSPADAPATARRATAQPATAAGAHLLVVIDHRLARVYKTELHGSLPQRIVPYDDAGAGRHLHHVEGEATGQRKAEVKSFYAAVAKTLERAEKILLFGAGTGASSAMDQLLAELGRHHKDVRERVIGSVVIDEGHLTEDQLLAQAREIYAGRAGH